MKESITRKLAINCCILCILPVLSMLFLTHVKFVLIFFLFVTIPTVILTIWIINFIKNRVTKPLNLLIKEAKTISAGNLSHPIGYEKEDELGNFILLFDEMRKTLEQQQIKQRTFEIERKHFITSISHDMKTPIASISAYIEALQDKIADTPEEETQYLNIIESKLTILTEFSKQLSLCYTLPEDLHLDFQEVNCYDWTNMLLKNIESECKIRGISSQLKNKVNKNNTAVMLIDFYQLDRAIQNILSNSFRYTKQLLSISTRIENKNLCLIIENDGCILATKNIDKIFERFYTEDYSDAQGHLGLGLSISKTIIQSMKGNLIAYLNEDVITFEIQIPWTLDSRRKI